VEGEGDGGFLQVRGVRTRRKERGSIRTAPACKCSRGRGGGVEGTREIGPAPCAPALSGAVPALSSLAPLLAVAAWGGALGWHARRRVTRGGVTCMACTEEHSWTAFPFPNHLVWTSQAT